VSVPLVQGLSVEQIRACERFALKVWGTGFFDYSPTHHGQHKGYSAPPCPDCKAYLKAERARELERREEAWRVNNITQPWQARTAA
jgi:hypothetical protein